MSTPTTNGAATAARKQISTIDSLHEQKRRLSDIQTDLLAICLAFDMPRKELADAEPWNKAFSGIRYRPHEKLQIMVRDVAESVAKQGSVAQKNAVRKAIERFYETLCADALEFLGTESEEPVGALTLETKREILEADCAVTVALMTGEPEDFKTAAREGSEALSHLERLRDRCLDQARARFYTPRTTGLFSQTTKKAASLA